MLFGLCKNAHRQPELEHSSEGYTDSRGNPDANRKLSEDRAQAVVNWLTEHGVERTRLTAKGYGQSRPVGTNSTDAGRQKNRRVEVVRLTAPSAKQE
jgi:OOP family OmpA-OmpF porin